MDFSGKSEHNYDKSTYFLLETGEGSVDDHTSECSKETSFYSSETMKAARKKYREKTGASENVAEDEGVDEPEVKVKKNSKRKAESDVPAKNVKKAKKEKLIKNTQTESTLPHVNDAEDSLPVVDDEVVIEVVELEDEAEVIIEEEATEEEEVPAGDNPEALEDEEELQEAFRAHGGLGDSEDEEELQEAFRAHGGFDDSEDDEEEEVQVTGEVGPDVEKGPDVERGPDVEEGKFARDLKEIFGDVQKKLEGNYNLLKHEEKSWLKFVRRMLFTWHPDKNPGFEDKATEVTKFIQNEVERIKNIIEI